MVIFDEGGNDPILKTTKLYSLQHGSSELLFLLPICCSRTDGWNLTNILSIFVVKEMHLREFAEEGMVYSRQESDDTIVVVYNNHRLPDDPLKPFVITSASDNKLFGSKRPKYGNLQGPKDWKGWFQYCLVVSLPHLMERRYCWHHLQKLRKNLCCNDFRWFIR